MNILPIWPAILLLAAGCKGESAIDDSGLTVEPECTTDEGCNGQEICEEQLCTLGDRNNDFETAVEIKLNDDKTEWIQTREDADTPCPIAIVVIVGGANSQIGEPISVDVPRVADGSAERVEFRVALELV